MGAPEATMGARFSSKRMLVPVAILAVIGVMAMPVGFGFSGGMHSDATGYPDNFEQFGCATSGCHSAEHAFTPGSFGLVSWSFVDAEGEPLAGIQYEPDTEYTVTITLDEQNEPDANNRAGFNLEASKGQFSLGEDENVHVTEDGMQAAHNNAGQTEWSFLWTAPPEEVVVFSLYVNDVNGNANADEGDQVHQAGWWFRDESGAVPGAAAEEEHFEVGVPLPQYWLGLIAIFGAAIVIIFGFVYLKFFSPHHADQKKR